MIDYDETLVHYRSGPASFLRHLVEIWELNTDELPGPILLSLLRSAILGREGGNVVINPREARAERSSRVTSLESADGRSLEAVLGRERFTGMTWWLAGLERCRAVARIDDLYEDAIGTGFLVAGEDLSADLPELVLVTNGHVVPENLAYGEAFAMFHGLVGDTTGQKRKFEVVRAWWYQPSKAASCHRSARSATAGQRHDGELLVVHAEIKLLNWRKWKTRVELANAIFEYIEIFHNRQRRHSALGYRTPTEYESQLSPA